uniref:SWIM-type domain-containing protein n=1 Tax=Romanomermis culicivorax TaxID=13658 RepID=A0A915JIP2_ROMCU
MKNSKDGKYISKNKEQIVKRNQNLPEDSPIWRHIINTNYQKLCINAITPHKNVKCYNFSLGCDCDILLRSNIANCLHVGAELVQNRSFSYMAVSTTIDDIVPRINNGRRQIDISFNADNRS